jgi:hypothetical protein
METSMLTYQTALTAIVPCAVETMNRMYTEDAAVTPNNTIS